ncbi:MAG: hypothetical protein IJO55_04095 [Lachnospiraceae bacterium]|nr:hypothetical protein [Lachnospiraceae bacterium]
MAKGIWRGVDNVARKVKAEWRGVDNVARKIKAEWRGVNGVARLCFKAGYSIRYWSQNMESTPHVENSTYSYGIVDGALRMYIKSVGVAYADEVRPHIFAGISDGTDMGGRVLSFRYKRNTFKGNKDDFCLTFLDQNSNWMEHDTSYGGTYSNELYGMLNSTSYQTISITIPSGARTILFVASYGISSSGYVEALVDNLTINNEAVF